jgi:hypothetical protein
MHVGRKLNKPWPIHIFDNDGVEHAIDLQVIVLSSPGWFMLPLLPIKTIFFPPHTTKQSARLAHFRPEPLDGEYYASLFVHYAPPDWPLTREMMDAMLPHDWDVGTTSQRPAALSSQPAAAAAKLAEEAQEPPPQRAEEL